MPGRAMAQVVSRWPLMRRPGFAPGSIHVEFVVHKVALGQVSLRVLRFSPVNMVHNLLSETLGTRNVSEIGIFRISEW
jgi:hypothetical protein